MAYAHQGIELRTIPGLPPQAPTAPQPRVAEGKGATQPEQRPAVLTKKGAEILVHVERLMDDATRELAARGEPGSRAETQGGPPQRVGPQGSTQGAVQRSGAFAAAADRAPTGAPRGN
jgi:penicillin-binding protein 1A